MIPTVWRHLLRDNEALPQNHHNNQVRSPASGIPLQHQKARRDRCHLLCSYGLKSKLLSFKQKVYEGESGFLCVSVPLSQQRKRTRCVPHASHYLTSYTYFSVILHVTLLLHVSDAKESHVSLQSPENKARDTEGRPIHSHKSYDSDPDARLHRR